MIISLVCLILEQMGWSTAGLPDLSLLHCHRQLIIWGSPGLGVTVDSQTLHSKIVSELELKEGKGKLQYKKFSFNCEMPSLQYLEVV